MLVKWSQEIMRLIYKTGSCTSLDNYRGISLTSVVGKVFTATLAHRMTASDHEDPWLPYTQASSRKGHTTADNLLLLSAIIDQSKYRKTSLFLGLIDVRKAFDSVRRPLLWQVLHARGVPDLLIAILQSLYQGTLKTVDWGAGQTQQFSGDKGVKQGDPLSGILFVHLLAHVSDDLMTTALGIRLGELIISHLLFADDIVICASSEDQFNSILQRLHTSLMSLGLDINTKKSKVIQMGPGSTHKTQWELRAMDGASLGIIEKVPEAKYLGVWLSHRKLGIAHGRHALSTAKWKVAQGIAQSSQSLDPQQVMRAIWTASIKPSILYGTDVMPFSPTVTARLEAQQMLAAKAILGVHSSTSATAVRGILQWLPLKQEMDIRVLQLWTRIQLAPSQSHLNKLMEVMRSNSSMFMWYAHVTNLLQQYEVTSKLPFPPNWRKYARDLVSDAYWTQWQTDMTPKLRSAPYQPGEGLVFSQDYSATDRALINRLRCGDMRKLSQGFRTDQPCPLCHAKLSEEEWIQHFLLSSPLCCSSQES